MKPDPPEESDSTTDPVRLWAAYGVSAAAALHVVTAVLLLIHHSR